MPRMLMQQPSLLLVSYVLCVVVYIIIVVVLCLPALDILVHGPYCSLSFSANKGLESCMHHKLVWP